MAIEIAVHRDDIVLEGSLMKESLYLKTWRLRWFVLTPDYLFAFKGQGDYKNPTEFVRLKQCSTVTCACAENALGTQSSFCVVSQERTFNLIASDSSDKEKWIGAIYRQMQNFRQTAIVEDILQSEHPPLEPAEAFVLSSAIEQSHRTDGLDDSISIAGSCKIGGLDNDDAWDDCVGTPCQSTSLSRLSLVSQRRTACGHVVDLPNGDPIIRSRTGNIFVYLVLPAVCLAFALCIWSRRATFWLDSNVAAQGLAPMREFGEFLHGQVADRIKQSVCTDGDTMSIVNSKQLHDLARKEWDRHPTIQNSNSQLFLWDSAAPVVERTSKWIGVGQSFGLFGKSTHPKKPAWNKNLDVNLWRNLAVISAGFEMNASTPYSKTFQHLMMLMMQTKIPFKESENTFYGVGFKAEDHGLNSLKQVGQHTLSLLHSLGSSAPSCCVIKDGRKCHRDCNGIDVVRFQLPRRHVEKLGLHDRNYVVEIRIGDKRSETFQELFGCAAEVLLISG